MQTFKPTDTILANATFLKPDPKDPSKSVPAGFAGWAIWTSSSDKDVIAPSRDSASAVITGATHTKGETSTIKVTGWKDFTHDAGTLLVIKADVTWDTDVTGNPSATLTFDPPTIATSDEEAAYKAGKKRR